MFYVYFVRHRLFFIEMYLRLCLMLPLHIPVANLALRKESFVSNRRQFKRHVRNQWTHGQAARAVDGDTDSTLHSCTLLDNFYVEKPVWMVDLGAKVKVSGVVVVTWQGQVDGQTSPRIQASRFNNSISSL